MNLEYLKNKIIPQRKKEIENGENACTAQPIYIVYNTEHDFISGHDDEGWYGGSTLVGKTSEVGYIDTGVDSEDRDFCKDSDEMITPEEVTKIYSQRFTALFFTRKGAEDYLKYQKHNLTEPFIYTHYSGYANREMDDLLQNT